MPQLANRTLASVAGSDYRGWREWIPDGIFVNLGTNDYCCGHAPDAVDFARGYLDFAQRLAGKYGVGPSAMPFFLGVGPMTMAYNQSAHLAAEMMASAGFDRVHVVKQALLTPGETGCHGHPNVVGHARMADEIGSVVGRVLGW